MPGRRVRRGPRRRASDHPGSRRPAGVCASSPGYRASRRAARPCLCSSNGGITTVDRQGIRCRGGEGDLLYPGRGVHEKSAVRRTKNATVAAYRSHDRTWWVGRVDPAVLGDAARENDSLDGDWRRRGVPVSSADIRPPLVVIHDPGGRFRPGCSTNSHFDAHDRAHTDPHADCAHGRALDHIVAVMQDGVGVSSDCPGRPSTASPHRSGSDAGSRRSTVRGSASARTTGWRRAGSR